MQAFGRVSIASEGEKLQLWTKRSDTARFICDFLVYGCGCDELPKSLDGPCGGETVFSPDTIARCYWLEGKEAPQAQRFPIPGIPDVLMVADFIRARVLHLDPAGPETCSVQTHWGPPYSHRLS